MKIPDHSFVVISLSISGLVALCGCCTGTVTAVAASTGIVGEGDDSAIEDGAGDEDGPTLLFFQSCFSSIYPNRNSVGNNLGFLLKLVVVPVPAVVVGVVVEAVSYPPPPKKKVAVFVGRLPLLLVVILVVVLLGVIVVGTVVNADTP